MTITPEEYRGKLLTAFPDEILKGFLLGVGDAYKSAPEHCKRHFDKEDRHDLLGRVRRGRVHESVRGVAERFAESHGIEYEDVPNSTGSTFFLCVLSGEIRMVCCLLSTRQAMVRPARIRQMWAQQNFDGQGGLFGNDSAAAMKLEHLAVLVHAPFGRQRDQVGFIDIVIPDRNFRHYNERIKLFDRFPAEAEVYRSLFKQRKRRGKGTA